MNAPAGAAALSPATLEPKFEWLPTASITPSDTQIQEHRRKRYDMALLQELAMSIGKSGVMQPVLVRPHPAPKALVRYELVAGERRWRAARLANLAHIPATIRELTAADVLELQLVENLQREDLHPLEEACGYDELMKVGKVRKEDIAARVGKSRSWVYSRLNLLKLEGDAMEALESGRLDVSRALVIASVAQPNQRAEALKLALETNYDNKPSYSVRELRAKIAEDKLTMPLAGAPFDPRDETLLPEMRDCTGCAFRTGNCDPGALDPDVCTNLSCYHLKVKAAGERRRRAAEDAGEKILEGDAARKISPSVKTVYDHVDLDHACVADEFPEEEPKQPKDVADGDWYDSHPLMKAWLERERLWQPRTYRQLLEGLKYEPILLTDPKTKQLRELLPFGAAQKLLKQKGITLGSYYNRKRPTFDRSGGGNRADAAERHRKEHEKWEQQRREREAREKKEIALRTAVLVATAEKCGGALEHQDLVAIANAVQAWDTKAGLRRVYTKVPKPDALKGETLLKFIRVALVADACGNTSESPAALYTLANRYKVDVAKIKKEHAGKDEPAEKPAASKTSAKKPRKK